MKMSSLSMVSRFLWGIMFLAVSASITPGIFAQGLTMKKVEDPENPGKSKIVIFIRHGESEWNAASALGAQNNPLWGWTDSPLTATGINQAWAARPTMARILENKKPGFMVANLRRAITTLFLSVPERFFGEKIWMTNALQEASSGSDSRSVAEGAYQKFKKGSFKNFFEAYAKDSMKYELEIAEGYSQFFSALFSKFSFRGGVKESISNVYHPFFLRSPTKWKLKKFLKELFAMEEDVVVVAGHAMWFRDGFMKTYGKDFEYEGRKYSDKELENGTVVKMDVEQKGKGTIKLKNVVLKYGDLKNGNSKTTWDENRVHPQQQTDFVQFIQLGLRHEGKLIESASSLPKYKSPYEKFDPTNVNYAILKNMVYPDEFSYPSLSLGETGETPKKFRTFIEKDVKDGDIHLIAQKKTSSNKFFQVIAEKELIQINKFAGREAFVTTDGSYTLFRLPENMKRKYYKFVDENGKKVSFLDAHKILVHFRVSFLEDVFPDTFWGVAKSDAAWHNRSLGPFLKKNLTNSEKTILGMEENIPKKPEPGSDDDPPKKPEPGSDNDPPKKPDPGSDDPQDSRSPTTLWNKAKGWVALAIAVCAIMLLLALCFSPCCAKKRKRKPRHSSIYGRLISSSPDRHSCEHHEVQHEDTRVTHMYGTVSDQTQHIPSAITEESGYTTDEIYLNSGDVHQEQPFSYGDELNDALRVRGPAAELHGAATRIQSNYRGSQARRTRDRIASSVQIEGYYYDKQF